MPAGYQTVFLQQVFGQKRLLRIISYPSPGTKRHAILLGRNSVTEDDVLLEVDQMSWEKVVEKGEHPAVVMFYTTTCPYCKAMEPYFRQYAAEYRDNITFARLNIEANQWIAERYGVRGTPTFKFFCSGRPVAEMVGAVYPALLKRMVEDVLKHGDKCIRNSTEIDYEISGYG